MTHSEKWRARDRKRKRERERERKREKESAYVCVYCRVGAKTVDGDQ